MAQFTINGISLDPVAQATALAAANLVAADASRSNYILIQAEAPLTNDQKVQLNALKVIIHEYIADNTYLCGYHPIDLAAIRALRFVTWVNVYMREFKIAPQLRPGAPGPRQFVIPPIVSPSASRALRNVNVILHDDIDPHSRRVKSDIATASGLKRDQLKVGRHKVQLTIPENLLDAVAAIDEVRHIEEVASVQVFNSVARTIMNADVVVAGVTYQGDGQVIAVADTGFDKGSTTGCHPAFAGRVLKLYAVGRKSPDMTDDPHGHGTHVAGSVLGDGTSSSMGGSIQGTAPKAKLVLQSLLDSNGQLSPPSSLSDLFEPPYRDDGARVHCNSWGNPKLTVGYLTAPAEIDEFVWDHQDCVICFAAGNGATDVNGKGVVDPNQLGAEAGAKNCITVGASENNRPGLHVQPYGKIPWVEGNKYPANPIHDDHIANNPDGMAAFSRRGPSGERRFKPDVVAPGTCILSARSANLATDSTVFGSSSDPAFRFLSGTSMANALVAGCAAVLRETLVKNGTPSPSAALIKALLINGAVELVGQYSPSEAGPSPNNNSGWGRVNLAGSVIIPGPNPNAGFGDGGPLKQGEEDTIGVHVPGPHDVHPGGGSPAGGGGPASGGGGGGGPPSLKVTLVWADPKGADLQNDLDLIVIAPDGQERHGNMGTSDGFDRINNVEQVVWENIPPGDAKIVIRAERITQFPQPYAYVWRTS